mgnify:CR=1 FL=1
MTKDCTNGGCACTPNQSIKCTVNNCAHHCQDSGYCGLNTIQKERGFVVPHQRSSSVCRDGESMRGLEG